MIIVNKGKDLIINVNNIDYIEIIRSEIGKTNFEIIANFTNTVVLLGSYETVERAKEVLQKISQSDGHYTRYEMPEE